MITNYWFCQLPERRKIIYDIKHQFRHTKTGKYSFLNLGIIQNVCMCRAGVVPTEKGTTPLKIGYIFPQKGTSKRDLKASEFEHTCFLDEPLT